MDQKKTDLELELHALLVETTNLSFKCFSSRQDKNSQLLEYKALYFRRLQKIADKYAHEFFISLEEANQLWTEAKSEANDKFFDLPEFSRLNSFYLQETMHLYVEKLIHSLLKGEDKCP